MALMKFKLPICLLALCCGLNSLPAAVIYVNPSATGNNTGQSWGDAFIELQVALLMAEPGDEIWVAAGSYFPTTGADRYASFVLPNGVNENEIIDVYNYFSEVPFSIQIKNSLVQNNRNTEKV